MPRNPFKDEWNWYEVIAFGVLLAAIVAILLTKFH